jgi:hypothetical protein
MSNATQHSRQSGDSRRRRSRGGKNRNRKQHDARHGGERGPREGRGRSEEFRPQGPRPPRGRQPVKLTWWQKLLKAVGLYKQPQPAGKPAVRPQGEPKPVKSNVRNARSGEADAAPKSADASGRQRGGRGGEARARGGDGTSVESPRVYVGNLSYDVTEQDLQELFKGIGGVRNVEIVYNRSTHRSKGYGFVEMLHKDEAVRAVEVLHDQHFMGRKLLVSGAKSKGQDEREDRDDEREARASRTVSLAPLPAAADAAAPDSGVAQASGVSTESAAAPADGEPVIHTIVESVVEETAPKSEVA